MKKQFARTKTPRSSSASSSKTNKFSENPEMEEKISVTKSIAQKRKKRISLFSQNPLK